MMTYSSPLPFALVIPWFGKNLTGTAEQQAWQIATCLSQRGVQVEVLTTCCRSFFDEWDTDYFAAGVSEEQGVVIRRFPVNARNRQKYERVESYLRNLPSRTLHPGAPLLLSEDEGCFVDESINSDALLIFLQHNKASYQAFLFTPYLYGPTLKGLPLVADRAYLQPCLHHEASAYLSSVDYIFRLARKIVYSSEEEAKSAKLLFGPGIFSKEIVIDERAELRHAHRHRDWIDFYDAEFGNAATSDTAMSPFSLKRRLKGIHQILPNLWHGNAISNQARIIRKYLQQQGMNSEIYARYVDPQIADEVKVFGQDNAIPPHEALLYHHSIGSEFAAHAIKHPGPKGLIYHNITPARFFEPYKPDVAERLKQGKQELSRLVRHFPFLISDSAYNAEDLSAFGATSRVLPLIIDPAYWNFPPDPVLMGDLQDGRTNIIFVGRIAPNKRQDHLIEAFAYYRMRDPGARLFVIGDFDPKCQYTRYVKSLIDKYHLENSVMLTGQVNDAQLQAYYRTAALFWSMSEHEGFGVPLIESMWFDVPVLAYKSSAVPETLGEAAFLFTQKNDFNAIAALARFVIENQELRRKILRAQAKRRQAFLPCNVLPILDDIISKIEEQI